MLQKSIFNKNNDALDDKTLSVVIPVHNESDVIEEVLNGYYREVILQRPNSELLVAEDGSTDGTCEILNRLSKEIQITLKTGTERKGYLLGLKDALLQARGDIIFYSDSDNTHNPKDFWKLYSELKEADLVCGVKMKRKDPLYRKVLSLFYNLMVFFRFGIYIKDINSGFKIMNKDVLDTVVPDIRYLKYGFSTELVIRAHHKGFVIKWVPIEHFDRKTGNADQFQMSNIPKVIRSQMAGLKSLKKELEGRS